MKKMYLSCFLISLCLAILASCSKQPSGSDSLGSSSNISQIQEISSSDLYQYFQQAFDTTGNALDTPEQLNLELAEVKVLIGTDALPNDYEKQYKEWRSKQIETILEKLYKEYDGIITDLPQNSGPIPGACYAEYIDFMYDGIPELFILSLERIPDYDGVDAGLRFAMEVYGFADGNVERLGKEYVDSWAGDSVGLCKDGESSFIHIWHYAGNGDDGSDEYYSIKDGAFSAVDRITRYDPGGAWMDESNYAYTSFENSISMEEYQSILSKYSETEVFASLEYTTPSITNRGILPSPSPDVLRRAAMLNALNYSSAQYACLADMDGDGIEDLVTQESYIFHTYIWDGTTLQAIDLCQRGGMIYGIYKEKSTGKVYVAYEDPIITAYYFERVSEVVTIDEDTYSFEGCYTEIDNRFEKIADDDVLFDNYEAIEAVRLQLLES